MLFFNLFKFLIETHNHTPSLEEQYLKEEFPNQVIILLVIILLLLIWLVFSDGVNEYRYHKKQKNKIQQEQSTNYIHCTNCGQKNPKQAKYCCNCGNHIVNPKEE